MNIHMSGINGLMKKVPKSCLSFSLPKDKGRKQIWTKKKKKSSLDDGPDIVSILEFSALYLWKIDFSCMCRSIPANFYNNLDVLRHVVILNLIPYSSQGNKKHLCKPQIKRNHSTYFITIISQTPVMNIFVAC